MSDPQTIEIESSFAFARPTSLPPFMYPRPSASTLVRKVGADFLVLLPLAIAIGVLNLAVKPYHRGFNCDDDSIRYPYRADTITPVVLGLYCISIPVLTILANEFALTLLFIFQNKNENENEANLRSQESSIRARQFPMRQFKLCFAWQAYIQLMWFVFAVAVSQTITDISKYTIGRLRPHFLDICRPQIRSTGQIINRFTACANPYTYVLDYECSMHDARNPWPTKDVHLSFMSGHSSVAAVCLVYVVIYAQTRLNVWWQPYPLVRSCTHLFQVMCICLTIYTGLSRISDYKHHWSDVLCGLITGTLVAIIVAVFVSDLCTNCDAKRTHEDENATLSRRQLIGGARHNISDTRPMRSHSINDT